MVEPVNGNTSNAGPAPAAPATPGEANPEDVVAFEVVATQPEGSATQPEGSATPIPMEGDPTPLSMVVNNEPIVPGTQATKSEIASEYEIAVQGAIKFFDTGQVVDLPDGTNSETAMAAFEANSNNTLWQMSNAGKHLQYIVDAKAKADMAGLELSPQDTENIKTLSENYRNFMFDMAEQAGAEALNLTQEVAQDVELEHAANKAHNKAKAWATVAQVTALAANPKSLMDAAIDPSNAISAINTTTGTARGEFLLDNMKPAVDGGVTGEPIDDSLLRGGDKLTEQFVDFGKFLNDEGLTETKNHMEKTNKFSANILERATEEVFAVGTLADLRANHAKINEKGSDARKFETITRNDPELGELTGPADLFAARDLEDMGYHCQVATKLQGTGYDEEVEQGFVEAGGYTHTYPAAIRDASGNVVYEKEADANNFFISNIEDDASGSGSAGLSRWDNGLDVSVNQQLDRIDDRWTHDTPEEEMAAIRYRIWTETA